METFDRQGQESTRKGDRVFSLTTGVCHVRDVFERRPTVTVSSNTTTSGNNSQGPTPKGRPVPVFLEARELCQPGVTPTVRVDCQT